MDGFVIVPEAGEGNRGGVWRGTGLVCSASWRWERRMKGLGGPQSNGNYNGRVRGQASSMP
jgi:hypothetical protein